MTHNSKRYARKTRVCGSLARRGLTRDSPPTHAGSSPTSSVGPSTARKPSNKPNKGKESMFARAGLDAPSRGGAGVSAAAANEAQVTAASFLAALPSHGPKDAPYPLLTAPRTQRAASFTSGAAAPLCHVHLLHTLHSAAVEVSHNVMPAP